MKENKCDKCGEIIEPEWQSPDPETLCKDCKEEEDEG